MEEKTIQELIKDKKVELFDLQLILGNLQSQLQIKINELNILIGKGKAEKSGG